MALPAIRESCVKCPKGVAIATCGGCQQWFCITHFNEHREELTRQIEDVGQDYDILRRDLNEENRKHQLLSRINDWEQRAIGKIQFAAEEARKDLQIYLEKNINTLNASAEKIVQDLRESRQSGNYSEIDLNKWIEQLNQLRHKLDYPSTIQIIDNEHILPNIQLIKHEQPKTQTQIVNKPS
jgi:hypothetical protein